MSLLDSLTPASAPKPKGARKVRPLDGDPMDPSTTLQTMNRAVATVRALLYDNPSGLDFDQLCKATGIARDRIAKPVSDLIGCGDVKRYIEPKTDRVYFKFAGEPARIGARAEQQQPKRNEPATPPVSGSAVPSKQGAEPVRVAATKTVAPQVPEAVRPGADDPPPVSATPSAAATVLKAAVAAPAVTGVAGPDNPASASAATEPAIPARVSAPAAAAAPKGDSFDIATEIALVAAANLAVMLHDFELPADVVRALSTFERAFAMQGRVQREARA